MTRKEEILLAALDLASEQGAGSVTLSMIAERVGIKKPSLYNHFGSKEELFGEMYAFLREQARKSSDAGTAEPDFGEPLEEILLGQLNGYLRFLSDRDMLRFFKVLYSERSTSPAAAEIMLRETERMVNAVKSLFYALAVHGRMKNEDLDTAALTYAMTVHSLVDREMDRMTSGVSEPPAEATADMRAFVGWFAAVTEVR